MFKLVERGLPVLQPYYKEKFGVDLQQELKETKPSYLNYHTMTTVRLGGYKDGYEYLKECSPYFRIKNIRRPCLFLNALNDPFMGDSVIDYEVFKKSPFAALATNKYAGHIGYHESMTKMSQWHPNPILDFLDGVRK